MITSDDLYFSFSTLSRDAELVDLMYRYARENLALVNVYIKDPAVTQVHNTNMERLGTIHKGRPQRGGVGSKADIVREVAWI